MPPPYLSPSLLWLSVHPIPPTSSRYLSPYQSPPTIALPIAVCRRRPPLWYYYCRTCYRMPSPCLLLSLLRYSLRRIYPSTQPDTLRRRDRSGLLSCPSFQIIAAVPVVFYRCRIYYGMPIVFPLCRRCYRGIYSSVLLWLPCCCLYAGIMMQPGRQVFAGALPVVQDVAIYRLFWPVVSRDVLVYAFCVGCYPVVLLSSRLWWWYWCFVCCCGVLSLYCLPSILYCHCRMKR